jgi:hypothetical protein
LHSAAVEVEMHEFVGIGVVSQMVTDYSCDCRTVEGTAMYYSSGEVHFTPFHLTPNPPHPAGETSSSSVLRDAPPMTVGNLITVYVDSREGTVWWVRDGQFIAMVRLWRPLDGVLSADTSSVGRVAFACVLNGKSSVRVLQPNN